MYKVCAVILTFNRPETFTQCINCVTGQSVTPDKILIVDNGNDPTTDETIATLLKKGIEIEVLRSLENIGPAGGFKNGIEWVVDQEIYDLIWIMDDDVYPEKRCLEVLLKEKNRSNFVMPSAKNARGEVATIFAWAGVLIDKGQVQKVGYPRADFFWWNEDSEYMQLRLRQLGGYNYVVSKEAKVLHLMERKKHTSAWKYYYYARNSYYTRLHIRKVNYYKYILVFGKLFGKIILQENQKFKKIGLLFLGLSHGIQGKLGRRINP